MAVPVRTAVRLPAAGKRAVAHILPPVLENPVTYLPLPAAGARAVAHILLLEYALTYLPLPAAGARDWVDHL